MPFNIPLNIRGNFVEKGCWRWLRGFFVARVPTGQGGKQQDEAPQQDAAAAEIKGDVVGLRPVVEPT